MEEQQPQYSSRITISFTGEMFDWLKRLAKLEHRTIADQVRYLVDLEQQRRQVAGNNGSATPR